MAKKEEIFVGLDAGSSKISVVVGKPDEDGVLSIIGYGVSHVTGVKKGIVTELEETVSGISEAAEVAERVCGLPISSASVNINGNHIYSFNSTGVIAVSRADQEITRNDIARAEEAAQAVQIPANKEIIHVIPRYFTVDGQEPVKDPAGMNGVRLELDAHVITVSSQAAKNINKCLNQAGIGVDDLIVSPIATAKAVLNKKQKELGCVLVDVGATTTGIIVYEDDTVVHTSVLPVGSAHITNDLAIGLRTSIEVAEKVKVKYGTVLVDEASEVEKVDLSGIDLKEEGIVSKRYIAEIVEARVEEIFKKVREELRKINKDGQLPGGVVVTGGGAKVKGIEDMAKRIFNLPAEIGKPHSLTGLTDKVYDPSMSTAVGLMLYAYEEGTHAGGTSPMPEFISKVRKLVKVFLP